MIGVSVSITVGDGTGACVTVGSRVSVGVGLNVEVSIGFSVGVYSLVGETASSASGTTVRVAVGSRVARSVAVTPAVVGQAGISNPYR